MGGTCSTYEEMRSMDRIFVGKPQRKKPRKYDLVVWIQLPQEKVQ
jgi:hypothetical protein